MQLGLTLAVIGVVALYRNRVKIYYDLTMGETFFEGSAPMTTKPFTFGRHSISTYKLENTHGETIDSLIDKGYSIRMIDRIERVKQPVERYESKTNPNKKFMFNGPKTTSVVDSTLAVMPLDEFYDKYKSDGNEGSYLNFGPVSRKNEWEYGVTYSQRWAVVQLFSRSGGPTYEFSSSQSTYGPTIFYTATSPVHGGWKS